jgi:hypothetical protein
LGSNPGSPLFRGAKALDDLAREGRLRLKEFDRDDRASTVASKMGNAHFEGDDMLWRLREENNRLERLIYSALLELEFSAGCFGNSAAIGS